MGPDQSGLPLFARGIEASGVPCGMVERSGSTWGECGDWYVWACDGAGHCFDGLGNRWRPAK